MKLFKNMMSRKPDPEETLGKIDLEMDVEPLRRRSEPLDDTGRPNRSRGTDALYADPTKPSYDRGEEPEEVEGAGWGSNAWDDDDWDDDEDWGDDEFDDDTSLDSPAAEEPRMTSKGSDWPAEEPFARKAIARSQLGASGESEDRILEETNTKMGDRETSRRRSAMAHLKAAAAATKADRVLKSVASRDPSSDPEEQGPYRDDLAKVVRPRTTSRPTSRSTSRPAANERKISTPWDFGELDADEARLATEAEGDFHLDPARSGGISASGHTDDDSGFPDGASRFADDPTDRLASPEDRFATDQSAFADDDDMSLEEPLYEDERAAHIPDDLSEDDFADDTDGSTAEFSANAADRFALDHDEEGTDDEEDLSVAPDEVSAAEEVEPEEEEFSSEVDDGPVPGTAVSEAVAMANAPDEPEEDLDDEEAEATVRRHIWNIAGDSPVVRDPIESTARQAVTQPAPSPVESETIVNVAAAVTGRAGRSAGRVKTRLLGFQEPDDVTPDVFETANKSATPAAQAKYPVGWIIVIEGPGHGTCFTLFNGVSQIGRGEDQAVRLDFGDTSISRNNHAAVAFDDEQSTFFLGHGGKSNLVRLNGRPVLSTEELSHGDRIRIGETTLKFIALCGEDFSWKMNGEDAGNGENA